MIWLLLLPPDSTDRDAPPFRAPGLANSPTPRTTAAPIQVSPVPTFSAAAGTGTAVPTTAPEQAATAEPAPSTYTVQAGDTLTSIARQFGVTVEALQTNNAITGNATLEVGQVLTIPR